MDTQLHVPTRLGKAPCSNSLPSRLALPQCPTPRYSAENQSQLRESFFNGFSSTHRQYAPGRQPSRAAALPVIRGLTPIEGPCPRRVQVPWLPAYRCRQSKQSGCETMAPRRKAHLPPAHPQPESVERNGHSLMALTSARDSNTAGRAGSCVGAGRSMIGASFIEDLARMCRILMSSGGSSAAHAQKAGQPRQTAGQGQFGHARRSLSVVRCWAWSIARPSAIREREHTDHGQNDQELIATEPPTGSLV